MGPYFAAAGRAMTTQGLYSMQAQQLVKDAGTMRQQARSLANQARLAQVSIKWCTIKVTLYSVKKCLIDTIWSQKVSYIIHHYIQRTIKWCTTKWRTIIYSAPLNGAPLYNYYTMIHSAPLNGAPLYSAP